MAFRGRGLNLTPNGVDEYGGFPLALEGGSTRVKSWGLARKRIHMEQRDMRKHVENGGKLA
jgi:hypothetical protein